MPRIQIRPAVTDCLPSVIHFVVYPWVSPPVAHQGGNVGSISAHHVDRAASRGWRGRDWGRVLGRLGANLPSLMVYWGSVRGLSPPLPVDTRLRLSHMSNGFGLSTVSAQI